MAVLNVSSPTKTEVYESLYLICHLTDQLTQHLERLHSAKLLAREFVEQEKETARELRAVVVASSTMNLTRPEMEEAGRRQKNRMRMQARLAHTKLKPKTKVKSTKK